MPARVFGREELERFGTRLSIICTFWVFPSLLLIVNVWRHKYGSKTEGKWQVAVSFTYSIIIVGVSSLLTLILRRLVSSPITCFRFRALWIFCTIWLLNPFVVLGAGVLSGEDWIKEMSFTPLCCATLALLQNRKMLDLSRRHDFRSRADNREAQLQEITTFGITRLVFVVLPCMLMNVQVSLWGAAAEAPRHWAIIDRMDNPGGLGLFYALILSKFIALIKAMSPQPNQPLPEPCSLFRVAKISFFALLITGDWLCLSCILQEDPKHPDEADFEKRKLIMCGLMWLMGASLLVLTLSPSGKVFFLKNCYD